MKNILSRITATTVVMLLPGCSTPDVGSFATQTAALQTAITAEDQEIAKQYDNVVDLTDLGTKEKWFDGPILPGTPTEDAAAKSLKSTFDPQAWRDGKASYLAISAKLEALTGDVTAYSAKLAELAAKGETGKQSVDQALGSLKDIASTFGIAAAGIPNGAVAIAEQIGDLVTRAQAQDSLDAAMNSITEQGGAEKVASLIELYTSNEANLAGALRSQRVILELYKTGPSVVAFYNHQSAWRTREHSFALLNLDDAAREQALSSRTESELYGRLLKCYSALSAGCSTAESSNFTGTEILLRSIRQDVRGFYDTTAQLASWDQQQRAKLAAIGDAADAWAKEHDKLASYLHQCAGLRVLRNQCGLYTAANLEAAVQRIQTLVTSLKDTPPLAAPPKS